MIIGTTLRQGGLIASRTSKCRSSSAALLPQSPLCTALHRYIDQSTSSSTSTTVRNQQQPQHSFFSTAIVSISKSHYYPKQPPIQQFLHHSFHASSSLLQSDAPVNNVKSEEEEVVVNGGISPSLRTAIIADLKSVDFDGNGRIDADELQALLGKYNDTFSEGEILELTEIFYTSTGAASVEIYRFMEALDAAASDKSTSGGGETADGEVSPLAVKGAFKTHPLGIGTCASEYMFTKTHGKYTEEDLNIEATHVPPVTFSDKTALFAVKCVRFVFDTATLWNFGSVTKNKILYRAIFLETIAAIPGMVAAIIRHFRSLRTMSRDGGMLNMFIEEANNERMHLLTFIRMKEPGYLFRAAVIGSQFGFGTFFLTAYIINPNWCHRFIGYIEEEAVHTYTKILKEFDNAEEGSELYMWKEEDAPKIAKGYWHLGEYGNVHDVMKAVRADEAEHRDVNHAVSGVPDDAVNPLYDPRAKLDGMLRKYVNDIMKKEASKQAA
mmetsp:Transcript_34696/g.73133  ORF Transcript_34696/g.73133 Transcript_34696/m.73133 type:complete len:496 (+) Transcript_34696:122-1609(+)